MGVKPRLQGTVLFDGAGVARLEEFAKVAGAFFGDDRVDLIVDDGLKIREMTPGAEDANRSWKTFALLHVGKLEGVIRARMMNVVDHQIGFADAVAELHDFNVAIGGAANALFAILAEDHGLAVFELQNVLAAGFFFGDPEPGTVVEDIAILQNFDERRTFVGGRCFKRVFEMALEDVHGASNESGFSADGQRNRIEWAVGRAEGRGLGDLLEFGSGRI